MGMMITGLVLWVLLHLFKRLLPRVRYDLGVIFGDDIPKGTLAILIIIGLLMIIFGYLRAPFIPLYTPPVWGFWAGNILMFVSLLFFGASAMNGKITAHIRHPLLSAVVLWSCAHLLSNGDLVSVILFGTLGFWAALQMTLISVQDDVWRRPTGGTGRNDLLLLATVSLLYLAISGLHYALDHNPFQEVHL